MQYLLNEDEMAAIRADRDKLRQLPGGYDHLEALKNVCQRVAMRFAEVGRAPPTGGRPPVPHGCIHVLDAENQPFATYCDHCPVRGICPQPKEYSK